MKRSAFVVFEEIVGFLSTSEEYFALDEVAAATNLTREELQKALHFLSRLELVALTDDKVALDPMLKEIMAVTR